MHPGESQHYGELHHYSDEMRDLFHICQYAEMERELHSTQVALLEVEKSPSDLF